MKTWDVIVIGGGVIGLALAYELRKHGAHVLVLERSEPGREASYAAAGMLAYCDPETPREIVDLCFASARLYPEFVHEIEDESGERVVFRRQGTIAFLDPHEVSPCSPAPELSPDELRALEPRLVAPSPHARLLPEQTVDNRALVSALLKACKHRGVDIATGTPATAVIRRQDRVAGVRTERTEFHADAVVNCAGAWAGAVQPIPLPMRPVKGQMMAVVLPQLHPIAPKDGGRLLLEHVVRTPDVYLVPRSDGRIVVGATVEEAGFDKRLDADVIQRFHQLAANLVPDIGEGRMLEAWSGLRPSSPDNLPVIGPTSLSGYFVAGAHFRNGILLSAITAKIMTALVRGEEPGFDIARFSPARFASTG